MGVILQNKHFTGVFRNWLQQPGSPKPWGQDSFHRELRKCGVRVPGLCPAVSVGYGGSGGTAGPSAWSLAATPTSVPEGRGFPEPVSIYRNSGLPGELGEPQSSAPALASWAPRPVPSLLRPGNVTWNLRIP